MPFAICGLQPQEGHHVEFDEYVPLTVQWPGYARLRQAPASVVLEAGSSIVEIKTDRDSSEVVELILVELAKPESSTATLPVPEAVEPGVPLMSFDESVTPGVGGVRLYADGLSLRFGERRSVRGVGDSVAVFGFCDQGNLVEFDLRLGLRGMSRLRALCGLVEA
ncbi:hypothetical protein NC658_32370 [Streptomyces griseoincarnatus]|uniref:Uncharacterized protein n=1 Tax=Streptomyces griseoincarnatus TaxID=29305 RepID=A0ABT0W2T2_STRGI|nr:hypothetical protein [Streptomyces griseoincarnatus]MCM2517891.1 hypothetical protein [Streptomyces griseoincarnatus]